MLNKFATILLVFSLAGCSQLPGFLTGGGTNVAANTQLGQENNQTVGQSNSTDFSVTRPQARSITQQDNSDVSSESIENVTINEVPLWIILLALIGWLLPTPQQMVMELFNLFRGKRNAIR